MSLASGLFFVVLILALLIGILWMVVIASIPVDVQGEEDGE